MKPPKNKDRVETEEEYRAKLLERNAILAKQNQKIEAVFDKMAKKFMEDIAQNLPDLVIDTMRQTLKEDCFKK